ncbi:MAG: FAD-dependent oxidoreductase [Deltaproteobacteria bacterium]|nr:FAD-dependent oxidoreductase [Deltaproteobacteria bacterium]
MGAAVKVLLTYERAFWRDAGFSGEVVSSDGPLSVVYDNTSHDGQQPALIGFVVGSQARQWSAQPLADRQRRVTSALKRYFGEEAGSFQEYRELDWGAEPWSRGCPVGGLPPGVLTHSFAHLRKPEGRIHWAGTESLPPNGSATWRVPSSQASAQRTKSCDGCSAAPLYLLGLMRTVTSLEAGVKLPSAYLSRGTRMLASGK